VDTNEKILAYLKFFVEMENSPGYAVLLNGPWGSGKTWLVNKLRDELKNQNDCKFIYVTLYGVRTTDQIEDQFFKQLHPVLSSKAFTVGAKLLKGMVKGALKVDLDFGDENAEAKIDVGAPNESLKKFLSETEKCVLIFDDIERCENLLDLMGYINHFVEHQGQKVILLGHEAKITDLPGYLQKKEKLIGRTFAVEPEVRSALSSFLEELKEPEVKLTLEKNVDVILDAFGRCEDRNLRTLKYGIIEYERFFSLLPERARKHSEFQSTCIHTFFSLCMELRSARLSPEDIGDMDERHQKHAAAVFIHGYKGNNGEVEPDPIADIYKKHFKDKDQEIVPNEDTYRHFFNAGSVPEQVMQEAIDTCRFFIMETTPAWIRLWHFRSLTEQEFAKVNAEVEKDFTEFRFTKTGELKHVAGMLIELSRKSILNLTYEDAVTLVKTTVETMSQSNLIERDDMTDPARHPLDNAYAGLGYSGYEDPAFRIVWDELKKYHERRKAEYLKAEAPDLLTLMKTDSGSFFRKLTIIPNVSSELSGVPVLHNIDAKEFVSALIEMDPAGTKRMNVSYVFKERYKFLNQYPALANELPWIKAVVAATEERLPTLGQPTKFSVGEVLVEIRAAISTIASYLNQKEALGPEAVPQPKRENDEGG